MVIDTIVDFPNQFDSVDLLHTRNSGLCSPEIGQIKRTLTRFHAAVSRITSLAADFTALLELLGAFRRHLILQILCESEVVPLLAQSFCTLKVAEDTDTEQIKITVEFFELITHCPGGNDYLIGFDIVKKLYALLSQLHYDNSNLACAVLRTLRKLQAPPPSRSPWSILVPSVNTLSSSNAVVALAHLLSHMRKADEQHFKAPQPATTVTEKDRDYYKHLNYVFRKLVHSASSLPYSAVSAFVPLFVNIVKYQLPPHRESRESRADVLDSLRCLFSNSDSSSGSDCETYDIPRHSGLADFVVSDGFDVFLPPSAGAPFESLREFISQFDAATFKIAFVPRIELILESVKEYNVYSVSESIEFTRFLALLACRALPFAHRLSCSADFARILNYIDGNFQTNPESDLLLDDVLQMFEVVFSFASDVSVAAQQLLVCGAVKICSRALMSYAMSNADSGSTLCNACKNQEKVNRLLCMLRKFIITGDTSPGPAVLGNATATRNPFVAEFIACRGLRALTMLRFHDCTLTGVASRNPPQLTQLHDLLVSMTVLAPETAATEELHRKTLVEMRTFASPRGHLQIAFDAYIAHCLQGSGVLQRSVSGCDFHVTGRTTQSPQHVVTPSEALLALREDTLIYARNKASLTAEHFTADVAMSVSFFDVRPSRVRYCMVIRLNHRNFPCNSAVFRSAVIDCRLRSEPHSCSMPRDQEAAALPFVTFYSEQARMCATAPLNIPDRDSVYGEYAIPARPNDAIDTDATAGVVYPAGTVLMYARNSVRFARQQHVYPYETVWFIAFKPCPASLLRGAVPVGRVVLCLPGNEVAARRDGGDEPFDTVTLGRFEMVYDGESCVANDVTTFRCFFCCFVNAQV